MSALAELSASMQRAADGLSVVPHAGTEAARASNGGERAVSSPRVVVPRPLEAVDLLGTRPPGP